MAGYDRLTAEGKRFYSQMDELKKLEVRVGYQAGDAVSDEGVDMCDIALWNELGTVGMPSRPFLRKTADEEEGKLANFGAAQVRKIAQGGTAKDCLQSVGVLAKGLVQEKIESGSFEPNAPSTIRKKSSDKPLIDTGRLRQSVNFIIKKKGGE